MKYYTNEVVKWQNFENVMEMTDSETGSIKMRGQIGNLKVNEISEGIYISGSLSKYYLGDNFKSLTRKTTKEAIEKLSDELSLKVENSLMNRIDISQNFKMQSKVKNYLNCLDYLNRFKKSVHDKSIYFHSDKVQLIFYDKTAEMRKKRQQIPESFIEYSGKILRYELRYKKALKKTFYQDIYLKDLKKEKFYFTILNEWESMYFKITKKNILKFKEMALKDIKQFQAALMLAGINALGPDEVNNMIEISRPELDRYQIKRIKDKIKQIKGMKELTEENPLIKELDTKIKNAAQYRL